MKPVWHVCVYACVRVRARVWWNNGIKFKFETPFGRKDTDERISKYILRGGNYENIILNNPNCLLLRTWNWTYGDHESWRLLCLVTTKLVKVYFIRCSQLYLNVASMAGISFRTKHTLTAGRIGAENLLDLKCLHNIALHPPCCVFGYVTGSTFYWV
jgi:hypothetical protein